MTNRQWVTFHIVWKAVSSHPFLWWPIGSEWHCTFCERQSHHIFSCGQQEVSDMAHFVKGILITSFPMTNREWVTLHILWNAVSSHFFLWWTVCEYCTFLKRQSHNVFSYDKQKVSLDIAHFMKGRLIPSFLMTNRKWVILHILWKALIISFPMTNSEWVTLHILWKAVSSHLFICLTACEWHCTFCERELHHIFSYDQQKVSDIPDFVKGSLITSFPMTNRKWVKFTFSESHSSHLFPWPTASEWHCTFCERQSHHIFSFKQLVSSFANLLTSILSIP